MDRSAPGRHQVGNHEKCNKNNGLATPHRRIEHAATQKRAFCSAAGHPPMEKFTPPVEKFSHPPMEKFTPPVEKFSGTLLCAARCGTRPGSRA